MTKRFWKTQRCWGKAEWLTANLMTIDGGGNIFTQPYGARGGHRRQRKGGSCGSATDGAAGTAEKKHECVRNLDTAVVAGLW